MTVEGIAVIILGPHRVEDPRVLHLSGSFSVIDDDFRRSQQLEMRLEFSKWYRMALDSCIRENVSYFTRQEIRKEAEDLNATYMGATLVDINLTQVPDAFWKVGGRGRGVIVRWEDILVGFETLKTT